MQRDAFLLAFYKGFYARLWFDAETQKWVGRILDSDDLMVFDGTSLEDALATFHGGIEEYIKISGERTGRQSKTEVLNMIRWGTEMPDFETAALEFLQEENNE